MLSSFSLSLISGYHDAQAKLHALVGSWFSPIGLEEIALRGAEIFLTPWFYIVLGVVWAAERFLPSDQNQKFFSFGMLYDFFVWFGFNSVLRIVAIGLFISGFEYLLTHHCSWAIVADAGALHPVVQVVLGILLVDFLNYFHHYLRHKVPAFWAFHAIHHSQKQMNIFTDMRVHLVEYLVAKPIVLVPLFIFGMGQVQIAWVIILLTSYSHIYHGNIRSSFGPLRFVLVTPQSHRIHHSSEPEHCDRNFGVVFCFWDRLFGTHWHDHTQYPETGVYDQAFPYEQTMGTKNPLVLYAVQFVYPFRVIVHAIRGKGWKLDGTGAPGRHALDESAVNVDLKSLEPDQSSV